MQLLLSLPLSTESAASRCASIASWSSLVSLCWSLWSECCGTTRVGRPWQGYLRCQRLQASTGSATPHAATTCQHDAAIFSKLSAAALQYSTQFEIVVGTLVFRAIWPKFERVRCVTPVIRAARTHVCDARSRLAGARPRAINLS